MIIRNNLNTVNKRDRINLTIGTFDAFHTGHLRVLNLLVRTSKHDKVKSGVITFQNRPKHILKEKNDGIILSNRDRIRLFNEKGIDYLFYFNFTKKFADIKAEDFIKKVTTVLNVNKILVGSDFRFGRGNKGNVRTLKIFQKKVGYKLIIIKTQNSDGKKISSTLIKRFIQNGDFQKVNELLGREYFIRGRVIKGEGTGIKIGFPTVNLQPEDKNIIMPGRGVYLSRIKFGTGSFYGMTYIGKNYFSGRFVIETNIFDFNKKIYNKKILVFLIKKLRKEIKFSILEHLRHQLLLDERKAREIIIKELEETQCGI